MTAPGATRTGRVQIDTDAVEDHPDPAQNNEIAGGGKKPAEDRIGQKADQEAQPQMPQQDAGQSRQRGRQGDHCRHRRKDGIRCKVARGDGRGPARQKDRGHILWVHDRAAEGEQDRPDRRHHGGPGKRQAKSAIKEDRQFSRIDDGGERDREDGCRQSDQQGTGKFSEQHIFLQQGELALSPEWPNRMFRHPCMRCSQRQVTCLR